MKAHSSLGIFYVGLAALGWAALGSWVLLMPPSVHPLAFSGARGLIIALSFVWVIVQAGKARRCSHHIPARIKFVILAGLAYGLASITYVASLGMIPVGMAAPLHYTSPVFLIFGTALVRRSIPKRHECAGVALGIIGALILLSRSPHGASFGATLAIASAGFWALYISMQGFLTPREKNLAACVGGTVMFLFSLPWYHIGLTAPSIAVLLLLAGVVSSSLPLACLTRASATLTPSSISLLLLCEPSVAAVLAYITTAQAIEPLKGVGLALITAGAASPLFAPSSRR